MHLFFYLKLNFIIKNLYELECLYFETIQSTIPYLYKSTGWRDQLVSYNGETFVYDSIGNPTIYRNKTISWSHARQLDSFGDIASFKYNANGIRISKSVNGITTKYYLNGNKIISQTDATNTLFFYYGTDGITGFNHNGTDYLYKKNIQGDIIGIYNPENKLICKYIYDAWGNHVCRILSNNGEYVDITDTSNYNINSNYITIANLNPFRYRSYYFDTETDLYYLNSRYYDPQTGRFINADSIENLDTENLNGFNLYMYCANNPILFIDDNGEGWKSFWNKIGNWVKRNLKELIIGTVFILAGALITAATAGAGIGFMAAFGSALLSSSIQVGTSIAVGIMVNGFINLANGENFFTNFGDTIANSFMWGGIFAGGSQILSGGFRVLKAKFNFKGIRTSKFSFMSPDALHYNLPGATILRLGTRNFHFALDLGRYGIHMHLFNKFHIWLIPEIVGLIELFKSRRN